jgi:hypothetical protein
MRPTVGQILSGLALGAVAASMLVMPERFIGADDAAVTGLVLQAPDERIVVRATPIPPRRVHRAAPVKRPVIMVERRAPVVVAISRRIPVRPRAAPPPPPPPQVRKVVTQRPKPPEPVAPRPASPAMQVASEGVTDQKDDAKGEKRKERKRKKWRDDDDEGDEDRRDRDKDRGERDEDRGDRGKDRGERDKDRHGRDDRDDKHGDDDD